MQNNTMSSKKNGARKRRSMNAKFVNQKDKREETS